MAWGKGVAINLPYAASPNAILDLQAAFVWLRWARGIKGTHDKQRQVLSPLVNVRAIVDPRTHQDALCPTKYTRMPRAPAVPI